MAAEAVLSVFLDKVANLLIEEARSLRGISDQLRWIEREMRQIHSFLRDARQEQFASHNIRTNHSYLRDTRQERNASLSISIWLADIQRTAYDAEDLIDTFILQNTQQRRRSFFKRYSLIFHDLLVLRKFAKDIERIQTNIRSISDRRSTYDIENIREDREVGLIFSVEKLRERRRTSPRSSQTIHIVSLSKDVELLEMRLVRGDNLRRNVVSIGDNLRRSVVSIVGMGGSGKTTLARTIYNSDIVRRHFDCFVWIYVSQRFEPKELLHEIENQLNKSSGEEKVSGSRENVVEQSLIHRKYLIVLDDVWTTDVWTRLQEIIPDNVNGSKIILTTRIRDVGIHADEEPHEVQLLNEEDSWMLFMHCAFKGKIKFPAPPDLIKLGKCIVEKCEGLPLAIVLMGGVLGTKDLTIDAWRRVFDSLQWRLNQDAFQCSSILALSFYDLPDYLRPCFLYFGIFPARFEIPVKRLIRLWIAEGFLHARGKEEPEDVGKDYIEELCDRNIIKLTYKKENVKKFFRSAEVDQKTKMALVPINGKSEGRSLICSMHGLVRELSISLAKENNFLDVYANESHDTSYSLAKERARRLAVHFDSESSPLEASSRKLQQLAVHFDSESSPSLEASSRKLQSLLCFDIREGETQRKQFGNILPKSILDKNKFILLKVLDLEGTYKPRLPKALGKLIHLRYIGLRRTWLEKLPSSAADLFNLQTLDLKCTEIQVIPQGIWEMEHLRHLYLDGGARSRVITGMNDYRSLRNLRTLYGIFVGEENCVRRKLYMLTKIRKLGIEGDLISQGEELADWIASLNRLEHLKLTSTAGELKLESSRARDRTCCSLNKLHLEGKITFFSRSSRCFLSNLTKLTLIGTLKEIKESDPMKELGWLENLRILRLWYNSYVGRSMVCFSGEFPKLEVLEVSWLDELKFWVVEGGAMRNLRELEINKCINLIQLPDGLRFLTNLRELRLPFMSDAQKNRILPNEGEDWYKIQHIPLISPPLDAAPATASASAPATASTASTSSSSQRPTV